MLFDCHSWSHSSWYFPGIHTVRFFFLSPFYFSFLDLRVRHVLQEARIFWLSVQKNSDIFPLKVTKCKSLYAVSLILSESLTLPSKAEYPGFLFSILFHVTCFKLRFIWIIKCFLKESFYTCLSFFKVNYWCSDKLKRLRIIIFSSPHSGLQKRLLTMVVYLE